MENTDLATLSRQVVGGSLSLPYMGRLLGASGMPHPTGKGIHNCVPVCIGWTGVRRMNACEVTASVTALANTLACQMSTDELNLLGVILTQLGDTILTIAAHREICGGK